MEIGSGAYSSVCVKLIEGKEYAEKISRMSKLRAAPDFVREWAVLGTLWHPNVMSVLDIAVEDARGETPGRFSLLFPLALCDALTMCKTMAYNPVEISFGIASGLAYLQSVGVYHCDVKLKNILIFRENGVLLPVIADFGHSEIEFSEVIPVNRTSTKSYRSPELHIIGSKVGYPSMVWSYGVVFYILFAQKAPFLTAKAENLALDLRTITQAVGLNCDERQRFAVPLDLELAKRSISLSDATADDLVARCLRVVPEDRLTFTEVLAHPLFTGRERLTYPSIHRELVLLRDYACVEVILHEFYKESDAFLRVFSGTCSLFCSARSLPGKLRERDLVLACFSLVTKIFTYKMDNRDKLHRSSVVRLENRLLRECCLSCVVPTVITLLDARQLPGAQRLVATRQLFRLLRQSTEGTVADLVASACLAFCQ